jgi:hypothetical protein
MRCGILVWLSLGHTSAKLKLETPSPNKEAPNKAKLVEISNGDSHQALAIGFRCL